MTYTMKNVPSFPPKHRVITPSDTTVFDYPTSVLVIDGGDVAIADEDGYVITYEAVPAWTVVPVIASRVMATNTTAANLIGIFGEQ